MRKWIWWILLGVHWGLAAQTLGPMESLDGLCPDWGAWAGLDLTKRWIRWEQSMGGEQCEIQFPLRSSACWGIRFTGGNFASVWSGEGIYVTHELAIAEDWNMRLGLGAHRALWKELTWVQWQPRFALALAMRREETNVSMWWANAPPSHLGQAILQSGLEIHRAWLPWRATVRYSTTGGFTGRIERQLDAKWEAQMGWSNRSMHVFFALIWRTGKGTVGLGCSEEVVGTNWFGHAVVH